MLRFRLFLLVCCISLLTVSPLPAQPQSEPPPPIPQLHCKGGQRVHGLEDRWSPWSTCPAPYQATGLQRVDLLGPHQNPIAHINDFQCGDQGCRAWCIGSACTVEARCCGLVFQQK